MSRALLDVNVLLALLDADHVDHLRARWWLEAEIDDGWASCAITQNGFVRIVSQPRYPSPISPAQALDLLGHACATPHHEFWPCALSLSLNASVSACSVAVAEPAPSSITDSRYCICTISFALHGGFVPPPLTPATNVPVPIRHPS